MIEESSSSDIETSIDNFNEGIIENCLKTHYIKNHFTDLKKIGAGGFGSVYEAKQTIDKKKYALKFIKIFSLNFEKNEVEILASLDHINVVRYYSSCIIPFQKSFSDLKEEDNSDSDISFEKEEDSCIQNTFFKGNSKSTCESSESSGQKWDAWLVIQTELCNPEKNLKTLIDNGELFKMDDRRRQSLFLDIVHGLQYIHNKGVMHRDLKPPNILIGMENRAKIGDFGFAKKYIMHDADEISSTSNEERACFSNNLGTPLYMAPEIQNSGVYDRKADLYSLGMILFEMYYKMGSGMERIQTMERLRNQEFNDLTNIPKRYRNVAVIVQNLLNHEPSLRMDLEIAKDMMNTLKHQEILEKTDVGAQGVKYPHTAFPEPAMKRSFLRQMSDHAASSEERHSIRSDLEQSSTESNPEPNINMNKSTDDENEHRRCDGDSGYEVNVVNIFVTVISGRSIFHISLVIVRVYPVPRRHTRT